MAREIDLTKPLNEAELRYLVDRDRWNDIRINARNLGLDEPAMPNKRDIRAQRPRTGVNARKREDAFEAIAKAMKVKVEDEEAAGESQTDLDSGDGEPVAVNYKKLTVPQLKEELDKRRADYEAAGDREGVDAVTYSESDLKDDLITILQEDDEEADNGGETGNTGN